LQTALEHLTPLQVTACGAAQPFHNPHYTLRAAKATKVLIELRQTETTGPDKQRAYIGFYLVKGKGTNRRGMHTSKT
jgi:hypothetical protein